MAPVGLAPVQLGSVTGERSMDPPLVNAFTFTVDALEIGSFAEVSGLAVQMGVEEVNEGGNNQAAIKLPGRLTWPNIVLKRGITNNNALFEWIRECSGDGYATRHNSFTPRTGSLTVYSPGHEPVRTWSFIEAFPVRWTGPQWSATGATAAVEELEICHGGFTVS